MRVPVGLARFLAVLLVVAVPILTLISPLYLFTSPLFVRYEYSLRNFPASLLYTPDERLRLSTTVVNYVRLQASFDELAGLRTDAGQLALRDKEVEHLVDVRQVMNGFFIAQRASLAVALLAAVGLWYSSRRSLLPRALRWGLWTAAGLIVLVVLAALLNFDVFFTRFHQIFFSADSWLFYATDTLIQLYPLPFWVATVWKMGVVILLEIGALYGITRWLDRAATRRGATT